MTHKTAKAVVPAAPYQLTEPERAADNANKDRKAARAPFVPLKVLGTDNGVCQLQIDHKDPAAAEALFREQLGTDDGTFSSYIAEQLGALSIVNGAVNANVLNAHLATVRAIGPRDEIETMLAAQMTAVHLLTMATGATAMQKAGPPRDVAIAQLNKLGRTFTTQVEALKRYRSKGDQKITVEHVDVHEGGHAVVGNVTQTRGSS